MDTRNVLLPTLAALLSGLLIAAPAAVAQEAQDLPGPVTESAPSKAPLGVPLMFGVEGLTRDNLEKVTRTLTSLTENVLGHFVERGVRIVEDVGERPSVTIREEPHANARWSAHTGISPAHAHPAENCTGTP